MRARKHVFSDNSAHMTHTYTHTHITQTIGVLCARKRFFSENGAHMTHTYTHTHITRTIGVQCEWKCVFSENGAHMAGAQSCQYHSLLPMKNATFTEKILKNGHIMTFSISSIYGYRRHRKCRN